MMKTTILLLAFTTFSGALARNCSGGVKYCASKLRNVGKISHFPRIPLPGILSLPVENYDDYLEAAMNRVPTAAENSDT
jgi:hypothetical protein